MPPKKRNTKHGSGSSRVLKAVITGIKLKVSRGDLSVMDVAKHCGVYRQSVYDWLYEGRTPAIDKIELMAELIYHRLTLVKA